MAALLALLFLYKNAPDVPDTPASRAFFKQVNDSVGDWRMHVAVAVIFGIILLLSR